jgi:putative hydrolase of the HAD superfamily
MVIFFDLDDTLLDDLAAKNHYMPKLYHHFIDCIKYNENEFYAKWKEAVPKYHNKYTNGEMTFEEQRAKRVQEAFGNSDLPESKVSEVVKVFDKYFKEGWKPFPDTNRILNFLKSFRKGIITNGSSKQQNEKIDILGIRNYFECILISEEVGISKPDERIFKMGCDRLDCSPSECLYIGDSWEIDVLGSNNASMKPIWFNRYKKPIPEPIEGLLIIEELNEIEKIIANSEKTKGMPILG